MRVIKVLFLLAFFFVCMLFFVQNTAILETPLVLKLGAFGFYAETPGVPFYVVLLLSFVLGGVFSSLYFLAERIKFSTQQRSLKNKIKTLEKQTPETNKPTPKSAASTANTTPSYAMAMPSANAESGSSSTSGDNTKDKGAA